MGDENDNLLMGFNGSLGVVTTKELKVTGLIGHAVSQNKKSSSVGETECGIGNTCLWKMCGIDPTSSYGIYFEVANQGGPTPVQQGPQRGMMQFLTYYQHSRDRRRRVPGGAQSPGTGGQNPGYRRRWPEECQEDHRHLSWSRPNPWFLCIRSALSSSLSSNGRLLVGSLNE